MKKVMLFLVFALALSVPAVALDTSGLEEALPSSARELMEGMSVMEAAADGGLFFRVWERCEQELSSRMGEAARAAGTALAAALLCSAAAAASPEGKMPGYMLLGGALAIFAVCAGDMRSFLDAAGTALDELSDFSRALLPCVAAASAAAGQAASGAARYTVSALFLDILITAGRSVVLPAIYAYAAVSTANAALPEGGLQGPVKLLSWGCGVLLTALTTAFTMALSLSGMTARGADKLTGSLAKTAISAALPVVGKIVADAADAYLAGAKLLRSAVGVFGLAAVLCVCLGPMLRLGLRYLFFKAAACVAEPFADGRLSALIGHMATCCGMALGLLGSAGFMLFVSVVFGTEALTG